MGSLMRPSLADLPDHVVDEILVRLPLREAVRTSVLSRAWRHRWQSIPELLLDDPQLPPAAIDKVLRLHSAPVRRFKLMTAHAHRWFISFSRRGVGHLLSLDLAFDYNAPFYPVHSSVFSFRETLTHLSLVRCSLPLPPHPSCSFPALRSLQLYSVEFPDDRQLSVLISGCPALEHLSLLDVWRCGSLRVHCPNLRSLELSVDCDRVELMSGQTLHELYIELDREDTDVELAELFRGVFCEGELSLKRSTMEGLHYGVGWISANDATGPSEAFWVSNQSLKLFASLRTVGVKTIMLQKPKLDFMRFSLPTTQPDPVKLFGYRTKA